MSNKLKKVASIPIIIGLLLIFYSSLSWSVFAIGSSARAESDEKVYYYLHDHLGGIEAVTDEEGNVVERRDYFPYGSERTSTGESDEDYGFTGKELDDETGLYYYDARYYDPTIARFTQIDPLVLDETVKPLTSILSNPQALNGYAYVLNNPLKYIDPNGEWGVLANGSGGAAHQYITRQAIEASNANIGFLKSAIMVNAASIWADFTVYKIGETKKSYNHSTSSGKSMTGLQIKEAIMNDAEKWYASDNIGDFGRLLHMVQDTFCPSHVERDENGNIHAFLDFDRQSLEFHMKYDNYKDENGEIRPEALRAIDATTQLINYRYNNTDWDTVKGYLDTEVLKGVNENTSVGTSGTRFKEENED